VLTLKAGFKIAGWLPKTTTIAWVGFVYYCVERLSGWQIAAGISIGTFLAVLAAFGYVRLRMFTADKPATGEVRSVVQ
jgi:hypothetical protein